MEYELLINVLGSALWALLGAAGYTLLTFLNRVLPGRRLWRLRDPKNILICVSANKTHDGYSFRPGTGVGHIHALGLALFSLSKSYKGIGAENILFSTDALRGREENDFLLLGGPNHNVWTARVIQMLKEMLGSELPVDQSDNSIEWNDGEGIRQFESTTRDGEIVHDYGLIVRMNNPFSRHKHTLVVLSGCHSYGTLAAARYFIEHIPIYDKRSARFGGEFVAVVGADIIDGWISNLRLERYKDLPTMTIEFRIRNGTK